MADDTHPESGIGGAEPIAVAIRIRPLNQRELESKAYNVWDTDGKSVWQLPCPLQNPITEEALHHFTFDSAFDASCTNETVYTQVAKRIVLSSIDGINGTIFVYGQTASGKTWTMEGVQKDPGIIPNALKEIFTSLESQSDEPVTVNMSYLEIYNENIKDLLNPNASNASFKLRTASDSFTTIVEGVKQVKLPNRKAAFHTLVEGSKQRQIGNTNMNEYSSRSHTILTLTFERQVVDPNTKQLTNVVKTSRLNLVDLAGSERVGHTGAEGQRLKEGAHINKSLLALSSVIQKLSAQCAANTDFHIPYRDSKLTRLLQGSLGGNSRTAMVCTITPASSHMDETVSTLKFALRAKDIENNPTVNVSLSTTRKSETDVLAMTNVILDREMRIAALLDSNRSLDVFKEAWRSVQQLMSECNAKRSHTELEISSMENEKVELSISQNSDSPPSKRQRTITSSDSSTEHIHSPKSVHLSSANPTVELLLNQIRTLIHDCDAYQQRSRELAELQASSDVQLNADAAEKAALDLAAVQLQYELSQHKELAESLQNELESTKASMDLAVNDRDQLLVLLEEQESRFKCASDQVIDLQATITQHSLTISNLEEQIDMFTKQANDTSATTSELKKQVQLANTCKAKLEGDLFHQQELCGTLEAKLVTLQALADRSEILGHQVYVLDRIVSTLSMEVCDSHVSFQQISDMLESVRTEYACSTETLNKEIDRITAQHETECNVLSTDLIQTKQELLREQDRASHTMVLIDTMRSEHASSIELLNQEINCLKTNADADRTTLLSDVAWSQQELLNEQARAAHAESQLNVACNEISAMQIRLVTDMDVVQQQLMAALNAKSGTESELSQVRETLEMVQQLNMDLEQQLTQSHTLTSSKLEHANSVINNLQSQIDQANSRSADYSVELASIQADLISKNNDLEQKSAELVTATTTIASLESQLTALMLTHQSELESVQEQLLQKTSELDQACVSISNLNSDIQVKITQIDGLNKLVCGLEDFIAHSQSLWDAESLNYQLRITALEADLVDANVKISDLSQTVSKNAKDIAEVQKDATTWECTALERQMEIDQYCDSLAKAESNVARLEQELDANVCLLENTNTQMNNKLLLIASAEHQHLEDNNTITQQAKEIDDLTMQLIYVKQQVTDATQLHAQHTQTLNNQLLELQSKFDLDSERHLQEMQSIEELHATQSFALQEQITDLQMQIKDAMTCVSDRSTVADALSGEITNLNKSLADQMDAFNLKLYASRTELDKALVANSCLLEMIDNKEHELQEKSNALRQCQIDFQAQTDQQNLLNQELVDLKLAFDQSKQNLVLSNQLNDSLNTQLRDANDSCVRLTSDLEQALANFTSMSNKYDALELRVAEQCNEMDIKTTNSIAHVKQLEKQRLDLCAELDTLKAATEEYAKQMDAKSTDFSTLQAQLVQALDECCHLKNTKHEMTESLATVQNALDISLNTKNNLSDQLQHALTTTASQVELINSKNAKLSDAEYELSDLRSQISSNAQIHQSLIQDFDQLQTEYACAKSALKAVECELSASVTSISEKDIMIAKLVGEKDSSAGQVQELTCIIDTLNQKIHSIDMELQTLLNERRSIEAKLTEVKSQVRILTHDKSVLESKLEQLQVDHSASSSESAALVNELNAKIILLENDLKSVHNCLEVVTLNETNQSQKIQDLDASLSKAVMERDSSISLANNLQGQLQDAKSEVTDLTVVIQKHKSKLLEAQESYSTLSAKLEKSVIEVAESQSKLAEMTVKFEHEMSRVMETNHTALLDLQNQLDAHIKSHADMLQVKEIELKSSHLDQEATRSKCNMIQRERDDLLQKLKTFQSSQSDSHTEQALHLQTELAKQVKLVQKQKEENVFLRTKITELEIKTVQRQNLTRQVTELGLENKRLTTLLNQTEIMMQQNIAATDSNTMVPRKTGGDMTADMDAKSYSELILEKNRLLLQISEKDNMICELEKQSRDLTAQINRHQQENIVSKSTCLGSGHKNVDVDYIHTDPSHQADVSKSVIHSAHHPSTRQALVPRPVVSSDHPQHVGANKPNNPGLENLHSGHPQSYITKDFKTTNPAACHVPAALDEFADLPAIPKTSRQRKKANDEQCAQQ